MPKKTPDDYARELLEMYRASVKEEAVPTNSADISESSPDLNEIKTEKTDAETFDDSVGGLVVSVTTLRRLYPVSGALITVFTGTPENMTVIETDVADESGKSKVFKLKTPSKAESQQPEASGEIPYAKYNVSVNSDGYVEQIALNIPVFSGVISMQSIDLIPLAAAGKNTGAQIIEGGSPYNL